MILSLASYIFMTAAIIVVARFISSETFADRMISLDAIGQLVILYLVYYSVTSLEYMYIDIAIALAMLMFIGTIALGKLVGGGKG